jgi:response regulator of citrate/malate metabolism
LQNNAQTATEILIANGLVDKNERLKQQLTKTRSESEQLKTIQNSNRKKIEELTKVISKQESLIESGILKLSGRKVSITE